MMSDEIYAWLRNQIVDGSLKVGDRIPSETELCLRWKTSRGTVRQALERLILLGIITKVRGSGSYVTDTGSRLLQDPLLLAILFKDPDLNELMLFQRTLDIGSARLCAENRSPSDLAELHDIMAVMQAEKNGPAYVQAARSFHLAIAKGTQSAVHLRFCQMLQQVLNRHLEDLERVVSMASGQEDYRRILSAIEEQDATLAVYHLERHLNRMINDLKTLLKQKGK